MIINPTLMSNYEVELPTVHRREVPFFSNSGDRCMPSTFHAVLAHFLPEQEFSETEADTLSGYRAGKGAWKTQCILSAVALGFEVRRIEDDDLRGFVDAPHAYMRARFPDPTTYQDQLAHSDLATESARVRQYLDLGLPYEQRRATRGDLEHLLQAGWLAQVFINGTDLFSTSDPPIPHAVLAIGFDTNHVTVHNPDGKYGNVPNQELPWPLLERAWDNHPSGTKGLTAFRQPNEKREALSELPDKAAT